MALGRHIAELSRRDRALVVGLALSAVWLLLMALFWLLGPRGGSGTGGLARLGQAVAVLLPLALIWLAVGLARAIAALRAEADDLRGKLAQMRAAADMAAPATTQAAPEPHRAQPPQQPAVAAANPPRPRPPASDTRQTAMRFDAPESVAVTPDELIAALNFPDGPEDQAAITALRAALRDHDNSRVIRAAQDVLTLMAGQHLYMDHLDPDPAAPALWRRFAEGLRGSQIAALGTAQNDEAAEQLRAMLKSDEIFRDTAHHFLRHFDTALGRILPQLDDAQIARLMDSRSARAFILLGSVTGAFG